MGGLPRAKMDPLQAVRSVVQQTIVVSERRYPAIYVAKVVHNNKVKLHFEAVASQRIRRSFEITGPLDSTGRLFALPLH